jgi:hypothetical protein
MNEVDGASLIPKPFRLKRVWFDQGLMMWSLLNGKRPDPWVVVIGSGGWIQVNKKERFSLNINRPPSQQSLSLGAEAMTVSIAKTSLSKGTIVLLTHCLVEKIQFSIVIA